MKPEDWVIKDMGTLRKKQDRTFEEEEYLKALLWYTKTIHSKE